jgi:tripartite-type tricarboxylate transporter receptor subunit TctC
MAALMGGSITTARAQAYPDKPVKVLMPWLDGFPANSTRLYTKELTERLKQQVIVDVRPGAGGEVAAKQVISAPPDGYTLLSTGSSITIRAVSDANNADGERDLRPIAQLVTTPYVIVAKAGTYGTFANFLAAARANPGKINYASAGVGTGMHFLGELLNANAGIQTVHVPYATGSRQLQAVLAGDVQIAIISLVTAWPQVKAGQFEALAVSSHKRSRVAGQVPTLLEVGIKDVPDIGAWIALFGPRNMDAATVKLLSDHIAAIAATPAVIETVTSWGADIPDTRSAYLEEVIRSEKQTWARLIKEKALVEPKK